MVMILLARYQNVSGNSTLQEFYFKTFTAIFILSLDLYNVNSQEYMNAVNKVKRPYHSYRPKL